MNFSRLREKSRQVHKFLSRSSPPLRYSCICGTHEASEHRLLVDSERRPCGESFQFLGNDLGDTTPD